MKHLCMVFVLIVVVGSLFAQTKLPMLARDDPKLGPYADVPDSATDWVAFDKKIAMQQEVWANISFGIIGAVAGGFAGSALFQTSTTIPATTTTATTPTWVPDPNGPVTDSTSGIWKFLTTTTPASTSTSSNGWAIAGGAVVGAAITVGIFELGHRVFKWW